MYLAEQTLDEAMNRMLGSAGHLLKIWLVLKHMGLREGAPPIEIDTANSTDSLKRLFYGGDPEGRFYIPFAYTKRYLSMASDASRSIIQTNIQRWASSGSVVTCDPTGYLDIIGGQDGALTVKAGRRYPFGLGSGENGFAIGDGQRVGVPASSFAVWYFRQENLDDNQQTTEHMISKMLEELNISEVERSLIFQDDDLAIDFQIKPIRLHKGKNRPNPAWKIQNN